MEEPRDNRLELWNATKRFAIIYLALVLLLNGTALALTLQDNSWGAIWVAIFASPVANAILAVVGIIAAILLRKLARHPLAISSLLPILVLCPFGGAVAVAMAVFLRPLHGC